MKKVLFLIFYILLFTLLWVKESFAITFSFKTEDGRNFCETDRFDGSYILCSKEQISGTGLSIAAKYGPQLLETTTQRFCVENGKEVDANLCSEQAAALESVKPVVVSTGAIQEVGPVTVDTWAIVQKPVISTGSVEQLPPVAISTSIEQWFSIASFIDGTMKQIKGMTRIQIFILAGIAFVIATILISVYYLVRRRRIKNLNPITSPLSSTHSSSNRVSSQNGEIAPHRVVNRWVPIPPPPPKHTSATPIATSIFTPPTNTPAAPATSLFSNIENNLPVSQSVPPSSPTQSSFLANHLWEL